MAKSTFSFIQGNTKEGLKFTVKNSVTGIAIDLTGHICTFKVSTLDLATSLFTKVCVNDPDQVTNKGVTVYTPDTTNFDTVGRYAGELHILFSDTTIGRVQGIKIIITDKAPS